MLRIRVYKINKITPKRYILANLKMYFLLCFITKNIFKTMIEKLKAFLSISLILVFYYTSIGALSDGICLDARAITPEP